MLQELCGKWDELNTLPHRDLIYSQATEPSVLISTSQNGCGGQESNLLCLPTSGL